MKTVIELFRELREDNDYSQSEIASVLGISQQHYSKYETGEYELPLRHFIKLAKYYDVSADYLIGRSVFDEKRLMTLPFWSICLSRKRKLHQVTVAVLVQACLTDVIRE